MATIHLITVGKLKNKNLQELETDYLKRLSKLPFQIHEVKASAENNQKEANEVLKKISKLSTNFTLILLDEHGETYTSQHFSKWLFSEIQYKDLIFVIGGAQGHNRELKEKCHKKISLSHLTFPHKLARLFFIEQIYRAYAIFNKHPYHNE